MAMRICHKVVGFARLLASRYGSRPSLLAGPHRGLIAEAGYLRSGRFRPSRGDEKMGRTVFFSRRLQVSSEVPR